MDALKPIIRKLVREAKKSYPGISESSADRVAVARIGLSLQHRDASDDMLHIYLQDAIVKNAEDGEEWAVEVSQILTDKVVRPAYDRALAAGVNPVPVLQANCGISEREARDLVATFEKDSETSDTEPEPVQNTAASDAAVSA